MKSMVPGQGEGADVAGVCKQPAMAEVNAALELVRKDRK